MPALCNRIGQHLAGVGPEPQGAEPAIVCSDPIAHCDDLARAAALIRAGGADPAHETGFARSLARTAGDEVME
ncbi:hypothetical protein [Tabrizicola sp. YIM 78059]|uniref:hypothetical protein n=1 Tax=Tabrizicola sp. YIM 78059 TaxID=2529861 RepID=UPI00145BADEC|nr:hypothetical protein [Tabrizicola sp. YIM 78059]